ncbi:MAG: LmbE family protein, partial [Bacteroidota bacterium]
PDQLLRGLPENRPAISASATIEIDDYYIDYELPLIYKRNDPVDGEVYRPFVLTPPVFMNIKDKVYVMSNGTSKEVAVKVTSGKANIDGSVSLSLPDGWTSKPVSQDFSMMLKGAEQEFMFEVIPPSYQSEGEVAAKVKMDGQTYNSSLTIIEYDHIPIQTLFTKSTAKVVNIDIVKRGQNIGYIMGAGDEIPASLRQIGYDVWEMSDEDITDENLASLDAVILGVRAYNTVPRLKFHQEKLLNFVNNGGNMIVQYNTNRRLVMEDVAPYPLTLSRDRVTVEEAPVRILAPDHPLIKGPNEITEKDFDGWVQERGLYFPNEWDDRFTPILSSNDPGETPKDGGLLVAKYGEGYYIYSGYSWFRELPAGVSGAYRLFTNMISIGMEPTLEEQTNIDTDKF